MRLAKNSDFMNNEQIAVVVLISLITEIDVLRCLGSFWIDIVVVVVCLCVFVVLHVSFSRCG